MLTEPLDSRKHIKELDGIRGFAVLLVLVYHYVYCQANDSVRHSGLWYVSKVTGLFWSGVDLFFVLSGFLIGGILIDNHLNRGFYRAFYIRRASRILPVYIFTLVCFFTLRPVLDGSYFGWLFFDRIPDLAYLTFTQNIFMGLENSFGANFLAITWSLAVEEQFYMALPCLFFFLRLPRLVKTISILIATAPFLRLAFPGFFQVVNTPFRMDTLLAGVLLAFVFRSPRCVEFLRQQRKLIWALFFVLLCGMSAMTVRQIGRDFCDPSVIAVFYSVFIGLALLYQDSRITRVLRSPLMVSLGIYSYGIYMYHQMIAGLMHGYLLQSPPSIKTVSGMWVTLGSLVLTMLLAVATHHTFEAYFIRQGRRFTYNASHGSP